MRLLVAGDTHGNTDFLCDHLYPAAAGIGADAIVQVGDFGYWEHHQSGVEFLDAVASTAKHHDIPLYWLHGNHDNWSLAVAKYTRRTADGFLRIRPRVNYIPNGYAWTWAGTRMRVFGGAYSIDKPYRLRLEADHLRKAQAREEHRRDVGLEPRDVASTAGTLWFPDEQMTDAEFDVLMAADAGLKDVIFSHDKPRGANPQITLSPVIECLPNQDRLQRALITHQPAIWLHGHLHHPYTDGVRHGDGQDAVTWVIGLSCDDQAAGRFWKPEHAWGVLDLTSGVPPTYTHGTVATDWYISPGGV